jgi:RHS repeat-associated protein
MFLAVAAVSAGLAGRVEAEDLPPVEVRGVDLFRLCADAGGTSITDAQGNFSNCYFGGMNLVLDRIGFVMGGSSAVMGNSGSGPGAARDSDRCNDTDAGNKAPGSKLGLVGNPVVVSTGSKVETEIDFAASGEMALFLSRTYNSAGHGVGLFGRHWKSNFDHKLTFGTHAVDACYPRPGGGTCGIGTNTVIWSHRPDGRIVKYVKNATDGVFYEEKPAAVAKIVRGADGAFTLHGEDRSIEIYSSAGYVSQIRSEHGVGWTFGYSGTYPVRVTHTSGRYADFVWSGGLLTSVRDPAGNYYGYAYHANRFGGGLHLLSAVSMPGAPASSVAYHYEDGRFPGALTGKTIGGIRHSWFAYDDGGLAVLSHHGGNVDRNTFSREIVGPNQLSVFTINPLGKETEYLFENGKIKSVTGHASDYCVGTYRETNYDANDYPDIVSDFNGRMTDFDYNAKGQLLRQVDAAGTPLARTTEYVWDNTHNRIVSVTIVGLRRIEFGYTTDHRLASLTEVNLSVHGVANQSRTTAYAYTRHANGMLATVTVDGPLAGNGDAVVTTFDPSGDLMSIANSLGHLVSYSDHNDLGQPGRITGPNGSITDYVYNARGRVVTERRWVAGVAADIVNAFNPQGLLSSITAPDGAVTHYEYDSARRLTRIWRNANGTVAGSASKEDQLYAYDAMGNVTRIDNRKLVGHHESQCKRWTTVEGVPECVEEQQVWVEVPTITRTAFADYDELGRMRAHRGNNGQIVRYGYDDNGNVTTITDAADRVATMVYDGLDRLITSTDPLNAITRFEYDVGDRITKVTDPKGLHTTYVYDGFGQLWAQHSPDTGATTFQYNVSGQRTAIVRNDGTSLGYTYDALGRTTYAGNADSARFFSYDWCQNGLGRLCGISVNDAREHLAWSHFFYTPGGQVAMRQDSVGGSDDWTGYAYDTSGRLTGLSYPSGISVGYAYANGKLTTMTATINGTNRIVAGGINYEPFAGPSNWTYGNDIARTYAHDLDGRVTGIWAGRAANDPVQGLFYSYDAHDRVAGIVNSMDGSLSQAYAYDAVGRLTTQTMPGDTMALAYDGTGNRTSRNDNGLSTTYGYAAGSHRLQTATSSNFGRAFTTTAVGNIDAWTDAAGAQNAMTYDAYQRPVTHTKNGIVTRYRFNALDQRVMKSQAGGSMNTRYIYMGQNTLLAERSSNATTSASQWTSYLWLGGQPVGLVKGSTLYWVSADHLGRPEIATNAAKQVVWRAANRAFDRGVALDHIGGYNLGYPGQYHDAESGLWHNGFRDYEPTLGRYIQSDPIGLAGGISTYGYVGGNPVSLVDPLGLVGYVCRQGNNIGIAIPIHFRGASQAQVARITRAIQSAWSGQFGQFNVRTVVVPRPRWDQGNGNQITVRASEGTSWVRSVDMNWGEWFFPGDWGDATFAHEAGHLLGLPDHGPGMMGDNLNRARVTEENIRGILSHANSAIRRGCGCAQ